MRYKTNLILFVIVFPENYKLDGVILSTVLATTLVEAPWETYVMFTRFFKTSQLRDYLKLQTRFVLIAILLSVVTWYGTNAVPIEGVFGLLVKGCVAAIISGSMTVLFFLSDIKVFMETLLNRNKKTLLH